MSEKIITDCGTTLYFDPDAIKNTTIWTIFRVNRKELNISLHNEDGPAIIRRDGVGREWWQNGKLHREDGPATVYEYKIGDNYYTQWALYGVQCSFEEWCEQLNKSEEEINFLKLKWNINE